ncbi:MAG: hypothetical protein ACR2K6_08785 [Solirubrobacterales bacterium]
MTKFEVTNLIAMRKALDRHNSRCPMEAEAILLHPYDHGVMGYDALWGIPVVADDSVPVKRCRIRCDGSAATIDEELSDYLDDG